jgi:NADPH-dependent ferric siderophore reductase
MIRDRVLKGTRKDRLSDYLVRVVLVDVGVVAFSKKKDIGVVAQLVVQSKCSSVRKLRRKEKGERQQIGKEMRVY